MIQIPPLAGLCSYEEAAQPGYSVDENVERFLRYAWIEKRVMELGLYWMNPTPEWEIKSALCLHLYLAAEHVKLIRQRISEMRNPPPRMDVSPSASLSAFLDELLTAEDSVERLAGLYGVLLPALLEAYQHHYAHANPLVDHPTRRMIKGIMDEVEEAVTWGRAAIAAHTESPEAKKRAAAWSEHLTAYLKATGGIAGDLPSENGNLPAPRYTGDFTPDFYPQRDSRFPNSYNFVFPPHAVARLDSASLEEKNLALMCKRALEMDVPEAMARMIAEADKDEPWDYYVDMCRQLWDEARHSMMGEVYFENNGVKNWRQQLALHIGFSLRLNLHMSALEAHAILYMIEQSLMPAKTGKRYEWEVSKQAHDEVATLFQDYDWADEVLHAQIGRKWLLPRLGMTRDEVIALAQSKSATWASDLDSYSAGTPQVDWWLDFVRQVLGREATPWQQVVVPVSQQSG
jgi:hypothetical protein